MVTAQENTGHPHAEQGHAHPVPVPPPPAALTQLLEEKRKEQQEINRPRLLDTAGSTAAGAVMGALGGIGGWLASVGVLGTKAFRQTFGGEKLRKFADEFERVGPAEQQRLAEEYGEKLEKNVERLLQEGGLMGSLARNPGTLITGAVILGGGYALYSNSKEHDAERKKIGGEVAALESIGKSWQERTVKEETPCGCHAKH